MVESCIHIANLLYLFSYLVRDMLWLRVLTCGGLVLGLFFFTCQPAPLYGPSAWHMVFLVINVYQIRSLLVQRRQQMLTEEQEQLGESAFHTLSRDELLTLLTHVTYEKPRTLTSLRQICEQQLTQDERVLRDLAFAGLSRGDLLNLLTRRMWNFLRRGTRKPSRWGRQRQAHRERGPADSTQEIMSGSTTG